MRGLWHPSSVTLGSPAPDQWPLSFLEGSPGEVGAGVGVERFFLKRKLFPVTFRASFGEPWTGGEGCVCPGRRQEGWEEGAGRS